MALEAGDADGVKEGKLTWIEKARAWLKRKRGEEPDGPKRPAKVRRKAHMWIASLNTALKNHAGDGLLYFKPGPENLADTPHLIVSPAIPRGHGPERSSLMGPIPRLPAGFSGLGGPLRPDDNHSLDDC